MEHSCRVFFIILLCWRVLPPTTHIKSNEDGQPNYPSPTSDPAFPSSDIYGWSEHGQWALLLVIPSNLLHLRVHLWVISIPSAINGSNNMADQVYVETFICSSRDVPGIISAKLMSINACATQLKAQLFSLPSLSRHPLECWPNYYASMIHIPTTLDQTVHHPSMSVLAVAKSIRTACASE